MSTPESRERDAARKRAAYVPGRGLGWRKGQAMPEAQRRARRLAAVRRYNESPKGRARTAAHVAVHGWGHAPGPAWEPMPMPYVGHPVFEQAAKVARLTSTSFSVDWGQNDIMGEATLAILEGRDPGQAVRAQRAAEKRIDRSRRWVADLGIDEDGHIYAAKDYDD